VKTAKELCQSSLRIPFSWKDRRAVFLAPEFLYVPPQIEHQESRLLLFEGKPIFIEFCSGTGHWITDRAKERSEIGWIAVEKKFERAKKIWEKVQKEKLANLFIVCSDALEFAKWYSPKALSAFINFPDPWPKRRHHKHRLIQVPFIQELLHVTAREVTCVTDDLPYALQAIQEFSKVQEWKLLSHKNEWPSYGSSFFQDLWVSGGRKIHYLTFGRVLHEA